uniref:Uncharacterized protein n=2 Tax=Wuchereria bancrofti TaxID=6293 RepID=A0A1I8EXT1_WUCBA
MKQIKIANHNNVLERSDFIFFTSFRLSMENQLIHRNYYWYTKGKEERLQNGSTPFGFDHLPPQTVLCVILHKVISCDAVMEALKHYKEYIHTDEFT